MLLKYQNKNYEKSDLRYNKNNSKINILNLIKFNII